MSAANLTGYGVWAHYERMPVQTAVEIERLGYSTIWIGGSPPGDLDGVEALLAATSTITLATGIVNVWSDDARTVGESYLRVEQNFPGRFLLGVGAGHREATDEYTKPYEKLVTYLDGLDEAGVPRTGRVLAALGPRVLELARDRTAGAHPYLTTPEHTREARAILAGDRLLVPEQKVVTVADPERARAIGRPPVEKPYLGLRNYVNNLKRLGFGDADLADGGSDSLIDALVAHGDAAAVASRLREHLDAGADQVAIQVLPAPDDDGILPSLRALAPVLFG